MEDGVDGKRLVDAVDLVVEGLWNMSDTATIHRQQTEVALVREQT